MNCTDFELVAQARLDERNPSLSPELVDHAAQCPACTVFWQGQLTLLTASRLWTPVAPPASLLQSVLAAPSQPEPVKPQSTPQTVITVTQSSRIAQGSAWAAMCSTAALLLRTFTMIRMSPPSEPAGMDATLAATTPATSPEDALGSQALASLWQEVHTEYQELSQETTRVLDRIGDLPESASMLPVLPASDPAATQPSRSWLRLTRPVSDRAGQAFDFLRDAVPGETPQSS